MSVLITPQHININNAYANHSVTILALNLLKIAAVFLNITWEVITMKKLFALALASFTLMTTHASAAILTENFEAPFPAWESGWLGTNSNLQNIYGVGQGRGNNPDGLWLFDGNDTDGIAKINFNAAFGSTITAFSIDTTTWIQGALFKAFDMNNNLLFSTNITSLAGAFSDPGSYQTISFTSANGMSGFEITGGQIEGNTSIDNVIVTTEAVNKVPEPASLGLLVAGIAGLCFSLGRKKAQ